MGFNKIRDLFLQNGKPEKVFDQRSKKGRRWRFGLVRFASLACDEMAVKFLDRFKGGWCYFGSEAGEIPLLGRSRHGSCGLIAGSRFWGKRSGGDLGFREGK